jgi:hypothetical protein
MKGLKELKTIQGTPRRLAVLAGVIGACLCIAACGASSSSTTSSGSGSSGTSTTASASSSRAALVACLKQHGVTLPANFGRFRRPGTGTTPGAGTTPGGGGPPAGGGFGGGGGALRNSKFGAAFRACGSKLGFRGRFGGGGAGRFRLSHTKIDQFVACVRKNGYDLPTPNFSGKGGIFPSSARSNPKFLAASKKCESLLVPSGGAGGGGPASSS